MNVEIVSFKINQKNTRQGYAEIKFTDLGLTIRDVAVHHFTDKGDRWWFAMPSRQYTDREGATKYWANVVFDDEPNKTFQTVAMNALRAYVPSLFGDEPQRRVEPPRQRPAQAPSYADRREHAATARPSPNLNDDIPF